MSINKEQYNLILQNWLEEFEKNPHYNQELDTIRTPLKAQSKTFLNQIYSERVGL